MPCKLSKSSQISKLRLVVRGKNQIVIGRRPNTAQTKFNEITHSCQAVGTVIVGDSLATT